MSTVVNFYLTELHFKYFFFGGGGGGRGGMKIFLPVRYALLCKLLSPKNWIVIFQKSNIAIKSEQCVRHHLLLSISFIHMWICLHWHYCCAFVTILIFLSKKYCTPSKWLWTCIEGKKYHCSIFACNTSTPTYNSYN